MFDWFGSGEVAQSDAHPWGTDNINMPIPTEFALRLRENNFDNPLARKYKNFLAFKTFRIIPVIVNSMPESYQNLIIVKSVLKSQPNVKIVGNRLRYVLLSQVDLVAFWRYHNFITDFKAGKTTMDKFDCHDIPNYGFCKDKLMLFDFVGTTEEIELSDQVINAAEKITEERPYQVLTYYDALFKLMRGGYTIEQSDFNVYADHANILNEIAISDKRFVVVPISVHMFTGNHAISFIVDNEAKRIYFLDSNGFEMDYITITEIALPDKFKDYARIPVLKSDQYPRGMFQAITEDSFCQTWNIFNMSLVVSNAARLNDVNDINEVFTEIIDHVKPICGYVGITDAVRLQLILLEFMFYIYCEHETDIRNFFNNLVNNNHMCTIGIDEIAEDIDRIVGKISDEERNYQIRKEQAEYAKICNGILKEIINRYRYNEDTGIYINNEFANIATVPDNMTPREYIEKVILGSSLNG